MFRGLREDEIEIRVGTVSKKGATLLLFKDARCDMNILDEVYGSEFWQRDHKEIKGNMYAGVAVWNDKLHTWIWKWDCGIESHTEKEKGEASDSFKRACVNLGIGRELYTSPLIFVKCDTVPKDDSKFPKYDLADRKIFYGAKVSEIDYEEIETRRIIKKLVILDKKGNVIFSTSGKSEQPSETEKIKVKKINKVQKASIEAELLRTGISEFIICEQYEVDKLEDLSFEQWTKIMSRFEKTPDK